MERVFEVYPLSELYVCDSVLPVMFSNQSQRTYSSCLKRFLHPLSNPASVNWKQPLWFSFLSLGHSEPSCQEFCQGTRWILGDHRRVYSIHGGDGVSLETCVLRMHSVCIKLPSFKWLESPCCALLEAWCGYISILYGFDDGTWKSLRVFLITPKLKYCLGERKIYSLILASIL